MKISVKQLRNIVRESVIDLGIAVVDDESYPEIHADEDEQMSKAKLFRMGRWSQSLHDRLQDEDDMPEWVQDKITTAEDRLRSAYEYMDYKLHRMNSCNIPVTESRARNVLTETIKLLK